MSYSSAFPRRAHYARPVHPAYAGLGVSIPGLPGVDSTKIVNAIVAEVGPPVTAYIKSQIPVLVDELKAQVPSLITAVKPQIQAGIQQLVPIVRSEAQAIGTQLLASPDVKRLERNAVIGAALFATAIVAGTWAAIKFL